MFSDARTRTNQTAVQICMILLMLICLLPVIAKPSVWYDESFTVNLVRKPVTELLRITAMDVHPPLYYLTVKLFTSLFGEHVWAYHLPSLLSYILLLLFTSLFFSKYFNGFTSTLVTAALCSMPNMIQYALELRMYSMSMLLILSGMYVAYIIISSSTDNTRLSWKSLKFWILLALINVSAAYTHYFAGVAAVGISLFMLLFIVLKYRQHVKIHLLCWGLYCVSMILLYLPWFPTLLAQMSAVSENYWITPLTEAALHQSPNILFIMSSEFMQSALKVFFVVGLFLLIAHISRNRRFFWLTGCLFVVCFWMLFGILYSLIKAPIFVNRYMIMLLPLIWIPVVCGYAFTANEHIPPLLFVLFAACFIQTYEEQYDLHAASADILLIDFGEQHIKDNDVFFHFYSQTISICNVYFPENEHYAFQFTLSKEPALSELTDCRQIESLDELLSVPGDIWCLGDNKMESFIEAGFQIETYELGTQQICRIYLRGEQE